MKEESQIQIHQKDINNSRDVDRIKESIKIMQINKKSKSKLEEEKYKWSKEHKSKEELDSKEREKINKKK